MRRIAFVAVLLTGCLSSVPPRVPAREDLPDRAAEFYAMKRGITAATDTHALYAAARERMAAMGRFSTVADEVIERSGRARVLTAPAFTLSAWTQLGPGNIGGRTRALVFDPTNPDTMYAGGVSGGIWKTTNAGTSWTAIGDELVNLAVNSLAIDPHDAKTLYAGTGEGYFREDVRGTALPIRGDGIFATHDGGGSWQQLAFTADNPDFQWVNDVAISAHDSHRLYAATRSGVWRSLDSGATWTRVQPTTVKGGCTDLALRTDTSGDYLFAACGVFEQATVYRNRNAEGAGSWEAVLSAPGMSRTSLAIAPSNPSVVYALTASNTPGPQSTTQNLQAVYRSTQNGDAGTWQVRTGSSDPDETNRVLLSNAIAVFQGQCLGHSGDGEWVPMGWHCNVIAVDPLNPNRVWAAGVDLFRSDDGGASWREASYWWANHDRPSFLHSDQHVIAFHPRYDGLSNQTMFAANDGGVYRTDNANAPLTAGTDGVCTPASSTVAFTSLNHNYGVTQFYHGAVFPDGLHFAGGAQDNGTLIGTTSSRETWRQGFGGDGGYIAIDPVNPNFFFAEAQYGDLIRTDDGGQTFDGPNLLPAGNSTQFLFIAPLMFDPNDHTHFWVGGKTIWRADSQVFKVASTPMPDNSMASALTVSPVRGTRVIAGTSSGAIVHTDLATTADSSTQWTISQPRGGYVSSLAYDRSNDSVVYATYAGFGGTHVWRSIDAGTTWSPFDGSDDGALPDIPVHCIALDPTHPQRLYLGTDLGVFVSLDDGAHWLVEESGFPPVITEWITIAPGPTGAPALYAFTHGRGAWRADLVTIGPKRRSARH
jgi:photosystem II stability/assembly factor-like uncharacterized protein